MIETKNKVNKKHSLECDLERQNSPKQFHYLLFWQNRTYYQILTFHQQFSMKVLLEKAQHLVLRENRFNPRGKTEIITPINILKSSFCSKKKQTGDNIQEKFFTNKKLPIETLMKRNPRDDSGHQKLSLLNAFFGIVFSSYQGSNAKEKTETLVFCFNNILRKESFWLMEEINLIVLRKMKLDIEKSLY